MNEANQAAQGPCPKCGSKNLIPFVYGMPDVEMIEKEQAGEIVVGGCSVYDDSPTWRCADCGHDFGEVHQATGVDTHDRRLKAEELEHLADDLDHLDPEKRAQVEFMLEKNKHKA